MSLLGKSATDKLIEHLEAQNALLAAENTALREQLLALVDKAAHQAVYRRPIQPSGPPSTTHSLPALMARKHAPLKPSETREQIEASFRTDKPATG